jgi:hypothetical protein
MSRLPASLIVGALLLSMASIGALAAPRSEWAVGRPAVADLNLVQYNDGGRCFNRCVRGRIFQRCLVTAPDGDTASCCSLACNRVNNWTDD